MKKSMKKAAALTLSAVMATGLLAGCGGDSGSAGNSTAGNGNSTAGNSSTGGSGSAGGGNRHL